MIDRITTEEQEAFLAELTELSRKYGIVIGGCGCCGSPYLMHIPDEAKTKKYYSAHNDDLGWGS